MNILPLLVATATVAPIATDRPTDTYSASTVPPGRVVVEVGMDFFRDDVITFPTLFRVGILEWMEVRLESGVVEFESSEEGGPVRFPGAGGGFKFSLLRKEDYHPKWLPDYSILLDVLWAPANTQEGDELNLRALVLLDWTLPYNFGLSFNTGGAYNLTRLTYALTSSWSPAFLTLFAGASGYVGPSDVLGVALEYDHYARVGVCVRWSDNAQYDMSIRWDLNAPHNTLFAAGFAFRM